MISNFDFSQLNKRIARFAKLSSPWTFNLFKCFQEIKSYSVWHFNRNGRNSLNKYSENKSPKPLVISVFIVSGLIELNWNFLDIKEKSQKPYIYKMKWKPADGRLPRNQTHFSKMVSAAISHVSNGIFMCSHRFLMLLSYIARNYFTYKNYDEAKKKQKRTQLDMSTHSVFITYVLSFQSSF